MSIADIGVFVIFLDELGQLGGIVPNRVFLRNV